MAVTHPASIRTILADAVVDSIDDGATAGFLIFQTSGAAEVAKLTFNDPAFGAASGPTATANAITSDTNAAGGTTDRFICQDSDLVAKGFAGNVLTSGGDINLSSLVIAATDTVSMSSLTYTAPP